LYSLKTYKNYNIGKKVLLILSAIVLSAGAGFILHFIFVHDPTYAPYKDIHTVGYSIMLATAIYFIQDLITGGGRSNLLSGKEPPHEFVYGMQLESIKRIPDAIGDFLSLEALDQDKIMIQTWTNYDTKDGIGLLIIYLKKIKNQEIKDLITSLENIEQIDNQREKAINLFTALIPYSDLLNNVTKRDELIVSVNYSVKRSGALNSSIKSVIAELVSKLDKPAQAKRFRDNKEPQNYLEGNINIYPLDLANKSGSNPAILEVRFTGLKGIFKYEQCKNSK
jgi:hypothetical protein